MSDRAPGHDYLGTRPLIGHRGVFLSVSANSPGYPRVQRIYEASLTIKQARGLARDLEHMADLSEAESRA